MSNLVVCASLNNLLPLCMQKADSAFDDFVAAAAELRGAEVWTLGRSARIAIFVNVYNMLVVHALALFGPPSASVRGAFFKQACYEIGGQVDLHT